MDFEQRNGKETEMSAQIRIFQRIFPLKEGNELGSTTTTGGFIIWS